MPSVVASEPLGFYAAQQFVQMARQGRPPGCVASIELDARLFGTHSLRRTKATLITRRTGNLRAVQLLLGHTKIESTVRYLGIEMDDALAIAQQTEV
jgi:integrase